MKNKEILEKLAQRTITYFKNELFLEMSDTYKISDVDKIDYFDITALISLSDDMIGTVGMSTTNKLSIKMVENFLASDIKEDELLEMSSENIAETLNITLGNILKELIVVQKGGNVEISTPYIMHNSVSITKKDNGVMYLCELKLDDEIIILSYFL